MEKVVDLKNRTSNAGNKMVDTASSSKEVKTVEHELKIMDVEGAVECAVIDIDDDEDDDGIVMADMDKVDSAQVIVLTEPLIDEEEYSKPEYASENDSNGSYSGPDPMGLLERMDARGMRNREGEDCSDDDSLSSGSGKQRLTLKERWQLWMKRWPWLLHEDSDNTYAFCQYCNIIINVNNTSKYMKQHNLSLYHQERESNYVAFKNSEEQQRAEAESKGVKHEFGSNSYVAAMKEKRSAEVEHLNNFNWIKWLEMHPWLERFQPGGTIGLCKYCNVTMNVEFVYLRKRHESTTRHRDAERQYNQKDNRKRKRSVSNAEASSDGKNETEPVDDNASERSTADELDLSRLEYCEFIPETSPQQVRCIVCDTKMVHTSYRRHLTTKNHFANLCVYKSKQNKKDRGIWAEYADAHPWLVPDPDDPNIAYCDVCKKRFMYGHSEIKRKFHENSTNHVAVLNADNVQANEGTAAAKALSEAELSEAASEDSGSDHEYNGNENEDGSSSQQSDKKRATFASKRKLKTAMPTVRHFSWLRFSKDRKMQLCKYCRVRIFSEGGKLRHDQSVQHKRYMAQFKLQLAARKKEQHPVVEQKVEPESNVANTSKTSNKKDHKAVPASMHGKVLLWKERFPWLSYKRNEVRPNYGWCKLCEISVFMPSFKFASKHQRTQRHMRLRRERKHGVVVPQTEAVAAPLTGDAKHKAAMAELQAKYAWFEPDSADENYGRCTTCDVRVPIKIFMVRQHDTSRKHLEQQENLEQEKRNSTAKTFVPDEVEPTNDADHESEEAISIRSFSTEDEPPPKRSRGSSDMRRILRALCHSNLQNERSQLNLAKDMIHSSFDIVSRLRNMERETQETSMSASPVRAVPEVTVMPQQPRSTIDLFFESISQTMKALPADLAAEGKAKIMQTICDLEVRAMRRNEMVTTERSTPTPQQNVTQNETEAVTDAEQTAAPDTSNSSTVIIEDVEEPVVANAQVIPNTPANKINNGKANARPQDVPKNIRQMVPANLNVTARNETDKVRCVPITKLTQTETATNSSTPKRSAPMFVTTNAATTTTVTFVDNHVNGVSSPTFVRNGTKVFRPAVQTNKQQQQSQLNIHVLQNAQAELQIAQSQLRTFSRPSNQPRQVPNNKPMQS